MKKVELQNTNFFLTKNCTLLHFQLTTMMVLSLVLGMWQVRIQRRGGGLGVRTPKLKKRGKKRCMHACECNVSVINSYPDPSLKSEILYLPLAGPLVPLPFGTPLNFINRGKCECTAITRALPTFQNLDLPLCGIICNRTSTMR